MPRKQPRTPARKTRSSAAARKASKPKRVRLPAEQRRAQILAAAQKVFVKSGLSGARTWEVSAEAGVNEATLFSHFATKDELFDEAVLGPLQALYEAQQESGRSFAASTNPEAQREITHADSEAYLRATLESYPLLIAALFSDTARGAKFYRSHFYPTMLKEIEAARAGIAHSGANLDPEVVALIGFGIHFAIVMDHKFRKTRLDIPRVARQIGDVLLAGVGNRPTGIKGTSA